MRNSLSVCMKDYSDVTSDRISCMEPYLEFLDDIKVKRKGVEKLREVNKNKKTGRFNNVEIESTNEKCSYCQSDDSVKVSLRSSTLTGSINYNTVCYICRDCFKEALDESEDILDTLDNNYYYYSEYGFLVKDRCINLNLKGGKNSKDGFDLVIGCNVYGTTVDIFEIKSILQKLKKGKAESETRCCVCGKQDWVINIKHNCSSSLHTVDICDYCRNDLIRNLEYYLNNNWEELLAKTI